MDIENIQNQLDDMKRNILQMQSYMMDMVEEIERTQQQLEEQKNDQLAG
ncbi:hypothetical protein [Salibacterium halotolerans]|uniref:Uncharacterized protein n=1 Tax=Salibacterium halotolerans TaxID=1884432 RepID=A0A1I5N7K8_9BACI|nr:hypothetical protein [Salibacterium halotolerans]SFP17582.1 hypothetical protein SAMN05518683_10321 [Salibacterium halotolerans]